MDKQTRWLRVEVPSELYDELKKQAKADDRELHVFLRRHLERMFVSTRVMRPKHCTCRPGESCPDCVEYIYHGTEIRATGPAEKYQITVGPDDNLGLTGESVHGTQAQPPVCLHDGVPEGTPMGVVCPCPKCSTLC